MLKMASYAIIELLYPTRIRFFRHHSKAMSFVWGTPEK